MDLGRAIIAIQFDTISRVGVLSLSLLLGRDVLLLGLFSRSNSLMR